MTSEKLRDDPIVEALLEIRFESSELPEVVVGRISDMANWKSATKTPLPMSELPARMRLENPQLRYLPLLEIKAINNIGAVRIGSNVFSLHFFPRI